MINTHKGTYKYDNARALSPLTLGTDFHFYKLNFTNTKIVTSLKVRFTNVFSHLNRYMTSELLPEIVQYKIDILMKILVKL